MLKILTVSREESAELNKFTTLEKTNVTSLDIAIASEKYIDQLMVRKHVRVITNVAVETGGYILPEYIYCDLSSFVVR